MKVSTLLEGLKYICCQGSTEQEVSTVVYDSRKVEENSLFICIRGAVVDGHKFVPDVIKKGAKTLVVEEEVEAPEDVTVIKVADTRYAMAFISAAYFGHPAEKLKTIGITGTKGKTTTTYMVKSILENAGYKVGLIGTIEAIIGEESIPASNTTPESYLVQEYFRKMVDAGCLISVPVAGSKCAPVQHMVNVFAAVMLGPWWGIGIAFCASLIRNLLGIGSLLAFPGSMVGALCCGLVFRLTRKLSLTCVAEALGTGILGGLAAYPVAKLLMGLAPAGFTVYMIPFFISTFTGSVLAFILLRVFEKSQVFLAARR